MNSKNALWRKDVWHGPALLGGARSDHCLLKNRIEVCSVSRELTEGGAPHDLADRGGRSDGVMLDDRLLRTCWDRARGRATLRT